MTAVTMVAARPPSRVAAEEGGRGLRVHLYGGDMRKGAPLAEWYEQIGITDVWLYPVKGAFLQDQRPETQRTFQQLEDDGVLAAYRDRTIHYWWFERPVPDFLYEVTKSEIFPETHIWDTSERTEALWQDICDRIGEIYPKVRQAGFSGIVYDNEAYYSERHWHRNKETPCLWIGHEDESGPEGNYYRRGLQVGRAISAAWPAATVIMVYAFGREVERWWYQGFADAGLDVRLGVEHTYGAGSREPGDTWYQYWWGGRNTKQTCDWKRTQFPFLQSNRQTVAGLFPVNFGARKPNYSAVHFREQLTSAASDDPVGPIDVWLWPQGPFTPESWADVDWPAGEAAEDYLSALRESSVHGK